MATNPAGQAVPKPTVLPFRQPVQRIPGSRPAPVGRQVSTHTIQEVVERLRRAQSTHRRNVEERTHQKEALLKSIRKSAFIVMVFAVCAAGVSDILSVADLGWMTSWIIPIVSWFMVRSINRINSRSDNIAAAVDIIQQQAQLMTQRLRPMLAASGNTQLLAQVHVTAVRAKASSYVRTFIRDTIITQLLELIPFVDMLPFYLGQVAKVIIDQNVAYQKAIRLMPQYDQAAQLLTTLERAEIEQYRRQAIQVITRLQRSQAATAA